MRVKCINDQTDVGIIRVKMEKESGLTVGKMYNVTLFSKADGSKYTDTHPYFLIFSDESKWEVYPVEMFEPV